MFLLATRTNGSHGILPAWALLLASLLTLASPGPAHSDPLFSAPYLVFGAGSRPSSVAIGDLNGDGCPDLSVANYGSNAVSVLLGNGDGTFGAKAAYDTGGEPISLAIADLSADGRPDLAVAGTYASTITVLLGTRGSPAAARVSLLSVEAAAERVLLRWSGDGAASLAASVYRRGSGTDWRNPGSPTPEGVDILRHEDRTIAAGERYWYRLGYQDGTRGRFTREIEV